MDSRETEMGQGWIPPLGHWWRSEGLWDLPTVSWAVTGTLRLGSAWCFWTVSHDASARGAAAGTALRQCPGRALGVTGQAGIERGAPGGRPGILGKDAYSLGASQRLWRSCALRTWGDLGLKQQVAQGRHSSRPGSPSTAAASPGHLPCKGT